MLHRFLDRLLKVGDLSVTFGDGRIRRYGDGSGRPAAIRLTRRGERRLAFNPALGFGEAYMYGDLVVTDGGLWDVLEVVGRNMAGPTTWEGPVVHWLQKLRQRLEQWNGRAASRRNVRHHYDLSLDLYRRFLDRDLQYSCAYFADPGMTLEQAQAAKKAHIAAKLHLSRGMSVLDVGCGWGGLGLELAGRHGAQVTGVTLSTEQHATARARAEAAGLAGSARFELTDYRDVAGPFDRIVSVGMLEHVGSPNIEAYFGQVARLLKDDGVALVHAIGNRCPPSPTQPFIARHIFPGGYIPSLSEVTKAVEKAGLWITDIEVLRLHYAETLRHWRLRFLAEREAIAALYDERFCRMWEVYLAMCEMGFRHLNAMVFQIQLTKRADALPLTRDYMIEAEQAAEPMLRRA